MKKIRIYWQELGGHTHMQIWTGPEEGTLGKAGDLCMTNEEFAAWKNNTAILEFIDQTTRPAA